MAFNRRTVLRGLLHGSAATMAVPLLDCFLDTNGEAIAATGKTIPTRFGTYFYGCGLNVPVWVPDKEGVGYTMKEQTKALEPYQAKLNLISGLRAIIDGRPNIQHWTGMAAVTTGIAPAKDGEFDSETLDQTIAGQIGRGVRFKSVQVACNGGARTSYASLGGANILPPEQTPLALYTRLFGPGFQDPSKPDWTPDPEVMLQQSILSVVGDERKRMIQAVGAADKQRLDQYFTSVRELENTLAAELRRPDIIAKVSIPEAPEELPTSNAVTELQRATPLFAKLLALALATDQTRVINMAWSIPASAIYMQGESQTYHTLTHTEPVDKVLGYQPITAKLGTISVSGFADLLRELDAIPEGDGTLLDHSLMMAYSESGYAKVHSVEDIPIILAGSANGRMKTGHHIAGKSGPVSQVGLTIQQAMGMPVDKWGGAAMVTDKAFTQILA